MADGLKVVVTREFEDSPRNACGASDCDDRTRRGSRCEDSPLQDPFSRLTLRRASSKTLSWRTAGTSPRAAAEAAVAAASEVPRVVTPRSLDSKDACGLRIRVSFRFAVIGAIVVAVLLSCLGMFVPLEHFTTRIREKTTSSCSKAVDVQRSLISRLLYQNVTTDAYTSLLSSLSIMVDRFVKDPSDQAVDALWGEMRTYYKFDPGFNGKSSAEQRMTLAYNSWVELSTQWASKKGIVVDFGPYTAAERRSAHPYSLYVGFDTEQFAGVHMDQSDEGAEVPVFLSMDAEGGAPGNRTTVHLHRMDASSGIRQEPAVSALPYTPTSRPYYSVQAQIAEEAQLHPGGASSVAATRAWSEIYAFTDSGVGTSWTAPVAFCGDYSCFGGVVAADVTLDYVSFDCWRQWVKLQNLLEDQIHKFIVGEQNSSIFIVNHVSNRFPTQQGLLVGSSHAPLAMLEGNLTQAVNSPQAVVGRTAQAIVEKFGEWNASELQSRKHLFTYRPSYLQRDPPVLQSCEPNTTNVVPDLDCLQVGTLSVALDEKTRWLVVATFPVGAFGAQATVVAQFVDAEVEQIETMSEIHVAEARTAGLSIFFGMTVLSIVFGVGLGFLVSRPLRKLSRLMRRLGDLDFAHDSSEFAELRSGHRSRISDVSKLQGTFCSLSRGIEAFARFVPETVVRNIVRGDPWSTQLHVSRREVTIMFSDIRDFTKIAEDLMQRDLLFVLTRYLSVMTRIVELFEGVVAEILGDGLLVFWNTPDDVEDHAAKACAAALAQQQALILLNNELARLGLPLLSIRIGLNTGPVLSGNIGSDMKMKFGCLGDPVNLANRLEGLCKYYGAGVVCNQTTYNALPKNAGFFCRRLDLIQVKDNTEPTTIYEVIGRELGDSAAGAPPSEAALSPSGTAPASVLPLADEAGGVEPFRRTYSNASKSSRASQGLWKVISGMVGRNHKEDQQPVADRACSSATLSSADAACAAVDCGVECANTPTPRDGGGPLPVSRDMVTPEQRRRAGLYEAALTAYQEARFEEAHAYVQALLAEDPEDAAAENLGDRISRYLAGGGLHLSEEERATWTGVHLLDK